MSMARIKLTLPQTFPFSTHLPVRITDLNYGGHVGNDSILSLIHEARMLFLRNAGLSELQFGPAGLIMSDVAIEFKHELFYGDALRVYVAAADFSRVGFDICYRMVREGEGKETVIALAKTGMICFDYTAKKIVQVPEEGKKALLG